MDTAAVAVAVLMNSLREVVRLDMGFSSSEGYGPCASSRLFRPCGLLSQRTSAPRNTPNTDFVSPNIKVSENRSMLRLNLIFENDGNKAADRYFSVAECYTCADKSMVWKRSFDS